MKLKDLLLTLSERETALLMEGLEHLPHKNQGGEMLGDIMGAALIKDPLKHEEFMAERRRKAKEAQHAKDLLLEEIRILQGKILMMKRAAREEELGKDIDTIFSGKNA